MVWAKFIINQINLTMKHTNILITIFLLFATLTLAAQNNYSPCYTNNMSKGNTAFSQGKYSEARTYYVTAKQCAGGNPAEAQKKIAACDAKIKAQKEAAEAKKRAEHEAAEAKKRAEEMRKKEEEARKAEEKQLAICPHSVKDYDGNVYATVYIGSQCWMAENLRTTHYAYGTSIDLGKDTSFSVAYYYYPDNKTSNATQYGLLYNWKAVMDFYSSSKNNPSGVQGICPRGWHVPSEAEWKQLIEYVASQDKYFCNGQAGYISKALASKEGWCPMGDYDDDCRVGNDP